MDQFTRQWITERAVPIVNSYNGLTLRALFYRLVADHGLTNSINHYKRVVAAMIKARWEGDINFEDFDDHERNLIGSTRYKETDVDSEVDSAKEAIKMWMSAYYKNMWENQDHYLEIWIEKKALQGVFQEVCQTNRVALFPCKGYPSLTWLDQARERLEEAYNNGKKPVILYFGDYDPSGEDIPRSIEENINKMGFYDFELERRALMHEQVIEFNLPPAPTKKTDSRSGAWNGIGQVELDAIEPRKLQQMCQEAINEYFDADKHDELMKEEDEEREEYREQLKEYVKTL